MQHDQQQWIFFYKSLICKSGFNRVDHHKWKNQPTLILVTKRAITSAYSWFGKLVLASCGD